MRTRGLTISYKNGFNCVFDLKMKPYNSYPVGHLLCRIFQGETLDNICRIVRGHINKYPRGDDPFSQDAVEKAEKYVLSVMGYEDFRPACLLAQGSFIRCMEHYRALDSETMSAFYQQEVARAHDESMLFTDIGFDSIGNFLRLCYNNYYIDLYNAVEFFNAMAAVKSRTANEDQNSLYNEFLKIFSHQDTVPGIEMQTLFDPDTEEFSNGYIINSFLAMVFFEFTHIKESPMKILRCQNPKCGKFFMAKRSSAKYCNFPSPQSPDRTCSDYCPQLMHSIKQKESELDHLIKNASSRLSMDKSRNPEKAEEISKLRSRLQIEGPDKKELVMNGSMTIEQFKEWLNTLRRQKGDTDYE